MVVIPSISRRDLWLSRLSTALAVVLLVVGGIELLCWQIWPQSDRVVFIKANTAFCYLVLGAVLLLIEKRHEPLRWFALVPALVSGLTLFEIITRINLRIDNLLLSGQQIASGVEISSRMTPISAIGLLVGSLVLLPSRHLKPTTNIALKALSGSLLLSAGFASLLGYLLNLPAIYSWGSTGNLSPGGAFLLNCLGAALLLRAWRGHRLSDPGIPSWLPLPVALASITVTLIVWIGLRDRERLYLFTTTQNTLNSYASAVALQFDRESSDIERLARRWSQLDPITAVVQEADAVTFIGDATGIRTLSWVSPAGETLWFYPSRGNETLLALDHFSDPVRADAINLAAENDRAVVSGSLRNAAGRPGFVIYAPVHQNGRLAGYVAAGYDYARFFQTIDNQLDVSRQHHLALSISGVTLYRAPNGVGPENFRDALATVINIYERRLRVELAPSPSQIRDTRRYLPELALGSGLGITLLIGLSVHLARSAFNGMDAAKRSNRQLLEENEERRRIEERLKLSDERLRLSLDATQIGIFEWTPDNDQLYINSGFWALLGQPDHLSFTTTAEWAARIHPDDVAAFNESIARLRSGEESFNSPEYRVRDAEDQWHWVYARGRVVAQHPDGRASRVVGTVQDITERRAAEAALRASQASARKLALVASRTDNLVIIATPEGRIEWINESFERILGHTLETVQDKPLVDYVTGADTPEATRRLILDALARRRGLVCDVTNRSRSGRDYHLRLELQPVFDEQGAIENFITIQADITARVQTELELRRAKAEADEASRAKSEFLASMSHEIRTPMNGVIGMTSLLLDTPLSADQRDCVNTIRVSGDSLLTIINDILDFSKIEAGHMDLEHVPFDLAVCIEETLDLFAAPAMAKGIELGYCMSPDTPAWVDGDITRLRQILANLVNNAVKFTDRGSISIEVRTTAPGRLEFKVADTGIGIPADRRDRLFKPFSQVDSSTTRKYGGTGLGLVICERLCRLMDGEIQVDSTPGVGSTFTVDLHLEASDGMPDATPPLPPALIDRDVIVLDPNPVNRCRYHAVLAAGGSRPVTMKTSAEALARLADAAHPVTAALIDGAFAQDSALIAALDLAGCKVAWQVSAGKNTAQPPSGPPPPVTLNKPVKTQSLLRALQQLCNPAAAGTPALPAADSAPILLSVRFPLRVLLVEDNLVNQKVALRFLDRLGYQADAVANGLEAVASLQSRHYDLVFMDLHMPEMDGLEATRRIRRLLSDNEQPRIIALTANAHEANRQECLEAGMDGFITKPIKLGDIEQAIIRHGQPA
ncbi:MAG: ATP-binding protein [Verrucomicrobiota bacterium]